VDLNHKSQIEGPASTFENPDFQLISELTTNIAGNQSWNYFLLVGYAAKLKSTRQPPKCPRGKGWTLTRLLVRHSPTMRKNKWQEPEDLLVQLYRLHFGYVKSALQGHFTAL
jgi:hypothetical protein